MSHSEYPEINVTIGNIHTTVGYVQYVESTDWISSPVVILSAAAVAAILILSISLATVLICRPYRGMKRMSKYQVQQSRSCDSPALIRLNRLAVNYDNDDKQTTYTNMYTDVLNEPGMVDNYNTLATDDQKSDTFSTSQLSQNSEHLELRKGDSQLFQNVLSQSLQKGGKHSKQPVRVKNKITVEIQLEGTTPTYVTLVPEVVDEQSYLHAVNYETEQ